MSQAEQPSNLRAAAKSVEVARIYRSESQPSESKFGETENSLELLRKASENETRDSRQEFGSLQNDSEDSSDNSGIISNNDDSNKSGNNINKPAEDQTKGGYEKLKISSSSSQSNASKFIGTISKASVRRKRTLRCRRHHLSNLNRDADHDHDGDIDRSDDEDCDNIESGDDDDSDYELDDSLAGNSSFASNKFTHFANASRWQQSELTSLRPRMRASGGQSAAQITEPASVCERRLSGGDNQDSIGSHNHNNHPKQDGLTSAAAEGKLIHFSSTITDKNNNCNSSTSYYYSNNRYKPRYKRKPQGVKKFNSSQCPSPRSSSFIKSDGIDSSSWTAVFSCLSRILGLGRLLQREDELNLSTGEPGENQIPSYRKVSDSRPFEWQPPGGSYLESMPTNNYGSNSSRAKPPRTGPGGELRSARRLSSRSLSQRDQQRYVYPAGYYRLGYQQPFKTRRETTTFQELHRWILLLLIIGICAVVLWQIYLILEADQNYLSVGISKSTLGQFNEFAISTDAKPCAAVGKNLLMKGGHAVDAAIGTLLCMGITLPNSLGLGGGCLMNIYDNKTKTAIVIDGRETAPDYSTENMFVNDPLQASRGPLSIGVPGELAAYWEAHQRYGKLNWSELFEDNIRLAEEGVPTVEHLSNALRTKSHAQYITQPLREILTNNATGEYYFEGELFAQPALAATLKRIRDFGADEFYKGKTGQLFVEDLQKQGGKMTFENLQNYSAEVLPALELELANDSKVHTAPLPGSGIVMGVILKIMKELGYYKNLRPQNSFEGASLFFHHLAEAFKFAYAQRAGLEDKPDDKTRIEKLIAHLKSDEFIKSSANKIDDKAHPPSYYGGLEYFQEDHGTAHCSVVDRDGNSVAVTSSVNLYFGSGLVSPSTGIIYNDIMDDFVSPNIVNKFGLQPSKFNHIKPGRRPLSSMCPSVFVNEKGNPTLVIGSSGGSQITTSVATVALRNVFLGEDIKTAIDGPRIHHQFLPNEILYENMFPEKLLEALADRGHKVQPITARSSVVMGIACIYDNQTKLLAANSDYRKGGSVDGF